TRRWVDAVRDRHDGGARAVPWTDLPREQVIDALTDRYLWQHASWSPTASRDVVRPVEGEEAYEGSVRSVEHTSELQSRLRQVREVRPRALPAALPFCRAAGWTRSATAMTAAPARCRGPICRANR